MAKRKLWLGSVGPYLFDDSDFKGLKSDGDLTLEDDVAGSATLAELILGGAAGVAAAEDISHIVILTGVPVDSESLGVFTGSTIPINSNIKEALQALETAVEGIGGSAQILGDGTPGRYIRMSRLRIQKGTASGVHFTLSSKWNGNTFDADNVAADSSSGGFSYLADKYRLKIDTPIIPTVIGVIASVAANKTGTVIISDADVDGTGILISLTREDGSNIDIDVAVATNDFSIDLFYITTA